MEFIVAVQCEIKDSIDHRLYKSTIGNGYIIPDRYKPLDTSLIPMRLVVCTTDRRVSDKDKILDISDVFNYYKVSTFKIADNIDMINHRYFRVINPDLDIPHSIYNKFRHNQLFNFSIVEAFVKDDELQVTPVTSCTINADNFRELLSILVYTQYKSNIIDSGVLTDPIIDVMYNNV